MSTKASLRSIARLLLLIGGIILILEAVLQLGVDLRGLLDFAPRVPSGHLHKCNSQRACRDPSSGRSGTNPQPRMEHHPAGPGVSIDWKPWRYTRLHWRPDRAGCDICLSRFQIS